MLQGFEGVIAVHLPLQSKAEDVSSNVVFFTGIAPPRRQKECEWVDQSLDADTEVGGGAERG